ncbi:MAG: GNAT family N-acetyltransferase [Acidobacteria bacterium]|nr:GNAT family N-acetyltransferase [Acidobacteriota bacterium]
MSLDKISLRPTTEGDEGFLRVVYAESRREELDQVEWPDGQREAFLRSQFDAQAAHYIKHYPGAEFQIIEVAGQAAGRLYVRRTAPEIRIMDIALVPEYRGKGIGTALLGQLIDEGRAARQMVTIHVEKWNPALRLYERLGFRVIEERGAYWFLQWAASEAAAV